jgi:hypothetical protein
MSKQYDIFIRAWSQACAGGVSMTKPQFALFVIKMEHMFKPYVVEAAKAYDKERIH